ncbi:MAG: TIGR02391 family protein [Saprospiraceae bacterium]|nr:TIGR02391 family protein [Candidatus Defluviibacterium haderslevense]
MNWNEVHPKVRELAKDRFNNGFYADAISNTLREINTIIKAEVLRISGTEYDGVDLMRQAFSFQYNNGNLIRNARILFVPDLTTESRRNIQDGYMNIFVGTISAIRNSKAHGNLNPNENKTRHLLQLSSLLFIKIEEAGLAIPETNKV